MTTLELYLLGVLGSIAVELAGLVRDLNEGEMPPRYNGWLYPAARVLFALTAAGPLPILVGSNNALNAFLVGASALLFLDRAAGTLPRE